MVAGQERDVARQAAAPDAALRPASPTAPIIAIDGPSGAGKSTVARELARRNGWRLVDTGAMYRAATWAALQRGLATSDAGALTALAATLPLRLGTRPDDQTVFVGDTDVTRAIRSAEVTAAVSAVSAVPGVREVMVGRQRALASSGGVVMEGRDIGTTVLPGADLKVFLTASADRRAARRSRETGEAAPEVAGALSLRDRLDSSRSASPLQQAPDALVIDSSELSVSEVVDRLERALVDRTASRPVNGARLAARGGGTALPAPPPPSRALIVVRWLAARLVRALLRVRVIGEDRVPSGGVLLAGNHTGFLDGPLVHILLRRPSCFLCKAELFDGFWARVLRFARQIPVHRGDPDRSALSAALAALADQQVVGMFPEGTRGEGKLETIQDGVGYIAAMSGAPVVPVVCRGTARALPRGKLVPRFGTRVDIVFGEPFHVGVQPPLRRADIHQAAAEIADQLRALVDEVGLG